MKSPFSLLEANQVALEETEANERLDFDEEFTPEEMEAVSLLIHPLKEFSNVISSPAFIY